MTDDRKTDLLFDAPADIKPKQRECLRCQSTFESQWAGERICARCKGTTAWRTGAPLPTASTGKQR
jgi:hypothetical protein